MAHFAKLDSDNIVLEVLVVSDTDCQDADGNESETVGVQFLTNLTGHSSWKQTSYNTLAGQHLSGGTPFRKNYAGIGYTYDSVKNAFIPPKPFSSWVLNNTTCNWEAPTSMPDDGNKYEWNESTTSWDLIT